MNNYSVGTVLAVDFFPVTHVGIATGRGWVISNSRARGGVYEESLRDFSDGRPIRVLGHLGNLPASRVVERARSKIGERWSLFSNNCEHFVRWAHGVKVASPQLENAVKAVGFFALLLVAVGGQSGGAVRGGR